MTEGKRRSPLMRLDLSQAFRPYLFRNLNDHRQCGYEIEYQVSRKHFDTDFQPKDAPNSDKELDGSAAFR